MPDARAAQARTLGVISDTHGLLRPAALRRLRQVDWIIHAGDVGRGELLPILAELAPVSVVRGNVDRGPWATRLPQTQVISFGELHIYLLHDLAELDLDPAAAGFGAVIFGHSHRPNLERHAGVVYLNPGSVGPRRFDLPISLAILHLEPEAMRAEFVTLEETISMEEPDDAPG
jgi:putative phosphoesterase